MHSATTQQHGNYHGRYSAQRTFPLTPCSQCLHGPHPSAEALNLDQLAQLADRIVKTSPTPTIAATTDTTYQQAAQVADLTKRLDQLTSQMFKTISSLSRRSHSHSSAPRQRHKYTSADPDNSLCWYHSKFMNDAKKCTPLWQKAGNDYARRFQ